MIKKLLKGAFIVFIGLFLSLVFALLTGPPFLSQIPVLNFVFYFHTFLPTLFVGMTVGERGWLYGLLIGISEIITFAIIGWFMYINISSFSTAPSYLLMLQSCIFEMCREVILGITGGLIGQLIRQSINRRFLRKSGQTGKK